MSQATNITSLTLEQERVALAALDTYLSAPPGPDGRTPVEVQAERDAQRVELIEHDLKPALAGFMSGTTDLATFKRHVDGLNKKNNRWGFVGVKGQMFFNMLTRQARDAAAFDSEVKSVLRVPLTETDAAACLQKFRQYAVRVGDEVISSGGSPQARPMATSSAFFASYFWQVQQRDVWPVFYTNTVQMITEMNLWQESGDIGDDYITYKRLHELLLPLFSKKADRKLTLYDVEHVFWFRSGRFIPGTPATRSAGKSPLPSAGPAPAAQPIIVEPMGLPNSYVPPIVAAIPKLALNDPEFQEVARRTSTTVDHALETSTHAAFKMLGYETQLLGKGKGRVPDGQALSVEYSYCVIWDTKARAESYKMGTDDRAIREYIERQGRDLRRRNLRNVYFVILSSAFTKDFGNLIRSLKMETGVSEVCLLEADALVAMVDQRLRSPLDVSLGPDGLQALFSKGGIITKADVLELLE